MRQGGHRQILHAPDSLSHIRLHFVRVDVLFLPDMLDSPQARCRKHVRNLVLWNRAVVGDAAS